MFLDDGAIMPGTNTFTGALSSSACCSVFFYLAAPRMNKSPLSSPEFSLPSGLARPL